MHVIVSFVYITNTTFKKINRTVFSLVQVQILRLFWHIGYNAGLVKERNHILYIVLICVDQSPGVFLFLHLFVDQFPGNCTLFFMILYL